MPRGFLFDAYGTLFDVHSVVMRAGAGIPGDLQKLSQLWRQKQLEYTWLRSLMELYEDFWSVTEAALRFALSQLAIEATEHQVQELMQAYLSPAAFGDARATLEALKGVPVGILSNGSTSMLDSAVKASELEIYFNAIISVDRVKTYKPAPRVYALGPELLKLPARDILFVSANAWDVAGAKAFGYRVCWCNRSGAKMENLGFTPDLEVANLGQVARFRA
jgi:2-haloacid dehalogenase